MRTSRFLAIAIMAIVFGFVGIAVSSWLLDDLGFAGTTSTSGMMMDGCMTDRGHMRGMMQRMMPGTLPPGIRFEDLPDPKSNGAKLLNHYCAQCHDLPSPASHAAEEGPTIANRMFARMSMMGGMRNIEYPSAQEQQAIVVYLKTYSMKSISPGTLPSTESQGAILFKETCSQCHALPNPKLHASGEWPKVVERMREHMQVMGKNVISEREKKDIVDYITAIARQ